MSNSVDVVIEGKVFCTLVEDRPPEKQRKMTRRRRETGGDDELHEEFDRGTKLHAHSDNNEVHVAFFWKSQRGKVAVPDKTRTGNYLKYLRGLRYVDIEGLWQACGRLLDKVDAHAEDQEDPKSKVES